ncbi:MAG TPA: LytTR family DNA-binding domain-containing protein [Saprospiraceae bacterium]|nr:response regulator transcription factor [Saprospiraceae bacterium]MCB9269051.1 response regulator transcription factor [Lewinellaceae bacterium]HPG05525.1 LytTR family DNA-binding domain-containing protein [Saprospiraceae bacterium]HPR01582.1 LytTR family DNA-binding domain-containing protein [Saprospiraceae bacterium]HRV85033.1 LytTR family DNA-binding domain-containing protein [Saprospiraceae bacterium]
MIRVVLVDDEEYPRLLLKELLEESFPEIEIIGDADNADDAYEMIENEEPDLVFLDIAMPEKTGFDLLQMFDHPDFEVIFVTGYDQYALDAFNHFAIGYLLKPIDSSMLTEVVLNAKKRIESKKSNANIQELLQHLSSSTRKTNRIGIPTMEGLEFVEMNEIIRCEGDQKYTKVYLTNRTNILSSYNIGEFRRILEHHNFFQCHKSHLVNLNHVRKYNKEGTLHMSDDSSVPVSKRKKIEFLNQLPRL